MTQDLPPQIGSGNAFTPLSLLDFSQGDLPDDLPAWEPSVALAQLGGSIPISSIPYTVSPLKTLDLIKRRLSRTVRLVGEQIDMERDVKELLTVAHPVYFPLYVSEWTFKLTDDSKARRITVVMNADDDNVSLLLLSGSKCNMRHLLVLVI